VIEWSSTPWRHDEKVWCCGGVKKNSTMVGTTGAKRPTPQTMDGWMADVVGVVEMRARCSSQANDRDRVGWSMV